jgi:NAD(P)-dependent dehydrogenase (short-subunit alcohol dehydrogenase family)
MKTPWTASDIPSQQGRRVVITGANGGIGFHTALELARHGAEVILPARTKAKADDAVARIRAEVPDAKLLAEITRLLKHRTAEDGLLEELDTNRFDSYRRERWPGK